MISAPHLPFLESLAIVTQVIPEHHTWPGLGRYSVYDGQGGGSFPGEKVEAQRSLGHCKQKPDAVRFCRAERRDFYYLHIIKLLILLGAVLQFVCGAHRTIFRDWFCPSTLWIPGMNSG